MWVSKAVCRAGERDIEIVEVGRCFNGHVVGI